MLALSKALLNENDFAELLSRIDGGGCPAVLSGIGSIHKAHVAAAIRHETNRPVVIVCSDEIEAKRMAGNVHSLAREPALLLTGREFTFYNVEVVSRQLEHERIRVLYSMVEQNAPVVVTTPDALMQRTIPADKMIESAYTLELGGSYDVEDTCNRLVRGGYSRCEQVEGMGQFALRGGILDFFSPSFPEPVRCEFFGDEIDSMSLFDVSTQRRTDAIMTARILPVAETLASMYPGGEAALGDALEELAEKLEKKAANPELVKNIRDDIERLKNKRTLPAADRYADLIFPMATAADYINEDAIILICEPARISERAKSYEKQQGEDFAVLLDAGVLEGGLVRYARGWDDICSRLEEYPVIMADSFTAGTYPMRPRALLNITAKQLPSYGGSFETAAEDVAHYIGSGYSTVVLCTDERRANILSDFFEERGISTALDFDMPKMPEKGSCVISVGVLSAGMEYPTSRIAVITEGQFAEIAVKRRVKKKKSNREKIASYADLSPGDLIVHDHHGIGRFVGIFKMPVDGIEKDYIKIAYAGKDSLYVPATQVDLISKYIGGGEETVRLSKMGGADWSRAKTKAKGAVKQLARELINLYAERQRISGHAFAEDSVWQTEFEDKFGYLETDDQIKCIDEIKADMERPTPMDRLLCGDVGYGKTEVALRAVMKCVLDGKQAAILVPTTVLAQQHYVTASQRFSGYPVSIEVLSRFRTPAQMKKAAKGITDGTVDIVIGTHRLLQKDIRFKKLGLLIVDEEQRFGVTHKERLKELAKNVDVLTLSATPIPRTLNTAMSGIRDMSMIEEPPRDRQPVQTYVLEHDWSILADAMRRECARGGQVYYLHNRVENIERVAVRISNMLDGVTVGVAHGKMDEESLSDVMERMASGDIQVLVCTTIIETGIDIPNVNTLIIEDADKLGLAQLHQIRGRVGRSSRRAFAYFTFRQGKSLTEVAEKRLSAIREFAEFNSGFKIAMRDLEIRGAGNLLGAEQSGNMVSVGYDMYLKLLEEAVLEEQGKKPEKRADCSADLTVSANIPEAYVPSGEQRMDLYRRIAQIRTEDDSDEMISELIDRYGDPPGSVIALVSIALLRGEATAAGITEISQKAGWLRFTLSDFELERVSALYSLPKYSGRVKIEAGNIPVVALKIRTPGRVIEEAANFVRAYIETESGETGSEQ